MSAADREHHIVVVANETVVSRALVELIEQRAQTGAVQVTVVAPVKVLLTQSERAALGVAVPGLVAPSPFSQFCTKTWLPPAL